MSTLLIDLGNTRLKWRLNIDLAVIQQQYTEADFEACLDATFSTLEAVQKVYIGSVASHNITTKLTAWCEHRWQAKIHSVSSTDQLSDLQNGYRKPEHLGVDRMLGMLAARHASQKAFCLVDTGTATTIDFVDEAGLHLGGYILPGLDMMRDCLLKNTSIPRDAHIHTKDIIGRDTPSGVAMAARYAVVALVERYLQGKHRVFNDHTVLLYLTGGNASVLAPLFEMPVIRKEFMVLDGLAVLATQ